MTSLKLIDVLQAKCQEIFKRYDVKVDAHSDFVRKVFKLVKIITQLEKSRPTQ